MRLARWRPEKDRTACRPSHLPEKGNHTGLSLVHSGMAKAIADPEELRRFAQTLKAFNTNLQQAMQQLQGSAIALGQTWRDQEYAKFQVEFEQTLRQFQRFLDTSEEQVPMLLRKADRIEAYLRQR